MSQMGLGYGLGYVSPAHSQCVSYLIDHTIGKMSWGIGICILMDLQLALACSLAIGMLGNDSFFISSFTAPYFGMCVHARFRLR